MSQASGEDLVASFSEVLAIERSVDVRPSATSKTQKESQQKGRRLSKTDLNEDYHGIQSVSSLGKLHSLAVWLRSSSLHSNIWDDEVGLRLGIDNATRWSSWYHVINNLFKKKAQIIQFMLNHEQDIGDNRLLSSDWDLLSKAHSFLQPFASATLYAEGDKASLSQSLFLMDCLLHHYEKQKVWLYVLFEYISINKLDVL